jgi:hypothetical protein
MPNKVRNWRERDSQPIGDEEKRDSKNAAFSHDERVFGIIPTPNLLKDECV